MSGTFFVVGAGILQVPMIREAQKLGYRVFATDGDSNAPGLAIANDGIVLDTYNTQGHIDLVRRLSATGAHIQGVATCGADVAPTVAAIANYLDLMGIKTEVANNTHNKFKVREILHQIGLDAYQPEWRLIHYGYPERDTYVNALLESWNGVVVKPLQQRASRGVKICRSHEDVAHGMQLIEPFLGKSRRFLAEELMDGSEHSAEILYAPRSRVVFFNIVDRMFTYTDGYAMEVGHVSPSSLGKQAWERVRFMVEQAAKALGVNWGPFKCDFIWAIDGPKILECTARLSGGFDCQSTIYMSRRNPIATLIQLACDTSANLEETTRDFSYSSYSGMYGACKAAFPSPGMVRVLPREDVIRGMSGVVAVYVTVNRRDVIEPYRHCAQRPGFVVAEANDYYDAWARACEAARKLETEYLIDHA